MKTLLPLIFLVLISCEVDKSSNTKQTNLDLNNKTPEEFSLTENCTITPPDTVISNSLFKIGYSKEWVTENKMAQGIDISWTKSDSVYFGFMLSVVPHNKTYFKRNQFINYKVFKKITFKSYEGIYLMRNDLFKDKNSNTVYWRGELKLKNPKTNNTYLLIFGSRSNKNIEPEWCSFSTIFDSFTIIKD